MQPLLSICIPTFQRAEKLRQTLNTITQQTCFEKTSDIEIVISDNASNDNTSAVCSEFQKRFLNKIRYIRQEKTIDSHFNFEKVLRLGNGKFLKLHNDTLQFQKEQLNHYINLLREYSDQISLFITPYLSPDSSEKEFHVKDTNMNDFLGHASHALTWIGSFCIKKEDFLNLDNPFRYWGKSLPHTDIILRVVAGGGHTLCARYHFFDPGEFVYRRYKFNHAEIFGQNYLGMLKEYADSGLLSQPAFELEKKRILIKCIIPFYFDFFHQYNAVKQKHYWMFTRMYHKNLYYYFLFVYIAFYYFCSNVIPLHQLCGAIKRKIYNHTAQK